MTHPPITRTWQDALNAAPQIIVISGEIGAGKTTWCAELVTHVRAEGYSVAGLLSVGVFDGDEKTAIHLVNLANDERRPLAEHRAIPDSDSPTPRWQFNAVNLAWGDAVLSAINGCDLLMVDELGPLELIHGQGWTAALTALERESYHVACVVVRPSLLDAFIRRFPAAWHFNIG